MLKPHDLGLPDTQLFDLGRQMRLEVARRAAKDKDVLLWGWALCPDKFNLTFCEELHRYFVEIRGDPFTNTEAPRNHSKTTIKCFLIPLFQALEEPKTFKHYLNVQATNPKALAVNTAIKSELEDNPLIKELYGNQVGDRWTDQQFVTQFGVVFTAVGAGQSIRGLAYHNIRPDYIIVDDLYDEEDIENPDSTEKKNRWFWGSLFPARAKSRRCSIHVQGTAINNYDLLEQLKKKTRWKSRSFKAIKDWEKKLVLWPELNTFDSLMADKEDMGSVIFFREMQNERRDDATSIIKRAWLQNWEYDPIWLQTELSRGKEMMLQAVVIGNDPSIGKDMEADENGTVLVIKTGFRDGKRNDYWIDKIDGRQLTLEERIQHLEQWAAAQHGTLGVTKVEIEAISAFDDYATIVLRRTNLPIHRVSWTKDKTTNLINRQHYFENGKVHLNRNIPQADKDKILYQLTTNHPKRDDIRDALLLTLDDTSGLWSFVK